MYIKNKSGTHRLIMKKTNNRKAMKYVTCSLKHIPAVFEEYRIIIKIDI